MSSWDQQHHPPPRAFNTIRSTLHNRGGDCSWLQCLRDVTYHSLAAAPPSLPPWAALHLRVNGRVLGCATGGAGAQDHGTISLYYIKTGKVTHLHQNVAELASSLFPRPFFSGDWRVPFSRALSLPQSLWLSPPPHLVLHMVPCHLCAHTVRRSACTSRLWDPTLPPLPEKESTAEDNAN